MLYTMIACGIVLGFCALLVEAGTLQDVNNIRAEILQNYSTESLPVQNQSHVLYMDAMFYLRSIIDVDELSGQVVTGFGLGLFWKDTSLDWDPSDFNGQDKIQVDNHRVWMPNLIVGNPGIRQERFGNGDEKVEIYSSGMVRWVGGSVQYTICEIDVTYFPFDEQVCHIDIALYEYGERLRFRPQISEIDLEYYIENGVWRIAKTTLGTYTEYDGHIQSLRGTLYIKRRAMFYIFNILLPVMILVVLNSIVFLLPSGSGERIGFAVTILLAIAVYMTIISEKLPETSNPLCILNYVMMAYLVQSAEICLLTVVNLRFFFRSESTPIHPNWVKIINCLQCKPRAVRVGDMKRNDEYTNKDDAQPALDDNITDDVDDRLTWSVLSETLDSLFLYLNISVSGVITISYFVAVSVRSRNY